MIKPTQSALVLALTLTLLTALESHLTTNKESHVPRRFVTITNKLDTMETVQLHCKDKHTDLGTHYIGYNGDYTFEADLPLFGSALYFCGFVFDNQLHRFDMYDQSRDITKCDGTQCNWIVTMDGPCILGPDSECFRWNT